MGRQNNRPVAGLISSCFPVFTLLYGTIRLNRRHTYPLLQLGVLLLLLPCTVWPQPQSRAARPAEALFPSLVDITTSTGINFNHLSTPEQRYIVESMSGGVALIDYDRDGYPDIYFTNAQSVEMAMKGKQAKAALYHNNHDGTLADVTD